MKIRRAFSLLMAVLLAFSVFTIKPAAARAEEETLDPVLILEEEQEPDLAVGEEEPDPLLALAEEEPEDALELQPAEEDSYDYAETLPAGSSATAENWTIGTDAIFNVSSSQEWWSYVYYGKYKGNNLRYRVLDTASTDFGGSTMLLDCDGVLWETDFNHQLDVSHPWGDSAIRAEVNGEAFLNNPECFNEFERNAIAESTKKNPAKLDGDGTNDPNNSYLYTGKFGVLNKDKIFILDAVEATRPSYGYVNTSLRDVLIHEPEYTRRFKRALENTRYWWTRTIGTPGWAVCTSMYWGEFEFNKPHAYTFQGLGFAAAGFSPAFNVKRSSIIGSTVVSGGYQEQKAEHKLTLRDENLKVIPLANAATRFGRKVEIPFGFQNDTVNDLDVRKVFLVITDGTWNNNSGWSVNARTKYCLETSDGSFVLPEDYDESWNVYLIAVHTTDGLDPDYGSVPVKVTIPENNYRIKDEQDWLRLVVSTEQYETDGLIVTLESDVEIREPLGSRAHPFCGIFDGNGHTLTVRKVNSPFGYTNNAVIRNLHTDGVIDTTAKFAGGFISNAAGTTTITNCRSSVKINSTMGSADNIADGTHGGFVAVAHKVTFDGCVFDGSIVGEYTSLCAGFLGWDTPDDEYGDSECINCVFDAQEISTAGGTANFIRNTYAAENSYYSRAIGQGRDRGKQMRTVAAAEGIEMNIGTETVRNYNVSGIIAYDTGLVYKGAFCAGAGDVVSLAMSEPPAEGKDYFTSAGTLTGTETQYVLEMADADALIECCYDIRDKEVVLSGTSFTYNGKAQEPAIESVNGWMLTQGTDYTIEYRNGEGTVDAAPTTAGDYTVIITGIGEYRGTSTGNFTIKPAIVTVPTAKTLTYTGKSQAGVSSGTNYTISGNKGTDAGSYKATASLKDKTNYTWADGTTANKTISWKIKAKAITPAVTLFAASYTYNGKARKPSVTVKSGSTTLDAANYKVSYKNNTNVGKASVTVTMKGNYSGSKTVSFKINPKGTTLSTLTAASKAFTAKWVKQDAKMSASRITGYQIQCATDSNFTQNTKTVTVEGYSKVSAKVTGLKSGKKYYVRIRTYKTIDGKKYYSGWSAKKGVTVK